MSSQSKEKSISKKNPSLTSGITLNPDYATIKCKKIGNYILSKTIGKGTFSKVKLGFHIPTQQKVAIKILDKSKIKDDKDLQRISREIKILKELRHNNIAQLYETLTSDKHIYIIMEYIEGGDLFEYIFSKTMLSETVTATLFKQLISVIEYIHKLGIVHRDIKPENILLNSSHSEIKLVDFGLSNSYKQGSLLSTACGSPCYASPEMILGKEYNGLSCDLWSCGVVLYCMLVGKLPFDDEDIKVLYKKIISGSYLIPEYLSSQCKHFLNRLLEINPAKRITIPEILSHSFIANNSTQQNDQGIIIGSDKIEIDYALVKEIKDLYCPLNKDITQETIISYLKSNNHNNLTTMYYLSFNQREKQRKAQLSQLKIERKKVDMFNVNNITKISFDKKKGKQINQHQSKNKHDVNKEMNFVVINNFVSENSRKKNMNMNININKPTISLNKNINNNNNIHLLNSRNQAKTNNSNQIFNTPLFNVSLNNKSTLFTNPSISNIQVVGNRAFSLSQNKTIKDVNTPSKDNIYQLTYNNEMINSNMNTKENTAKQKTISKSLQLNDFNNIQINLKQNKDKTISNNEKILKKSSSNKKSEIAKLKNDFKEILTKYRNKSQGKDDKIELSSQTPNKIITKPNKQLFMKKIFNDEKIPSSDLSNNSMITKTIHHPHPHPHVYLNPPKQQKDIEQTIPLTKTRVNNHLLNKKKFNWNLNTSMTYERSISKHSKENNNEEMTTLSSFQKIIKNWEECKKKANLFKGKPQVIQIELSSNNDNSISLI